MKFIKTKSTYRLDIKKQIVSKWYTSQDVNLVMNRKGKAITVFVTADRKPRLRVDKKTNMAYITIKNVNDATVTTKSISDFVNFDLVGDEIYGIEVFL